MMTLFDMLTEAQNGAAAKELSKQFGLNQNQTTSALEALLPAFSEGLKRNASDPMGVGGFLQALSSGQHAKYFEDAQAAFQPSGVQEGNAILGHLFGNKEVSRAVAKQAEATTGVGQEILKQMLPVIASMVMGGLFKQSTGQMNATPQASSGNVLGDLLGQMMKQGMGGASGGAAKQPANPFGQILEQMMGGGASGNQAAQNPMDNNPLGKIFADMMKGGGIQGMSQPAPQAATEPTPQPASNPYGELFGKMFDTGREVQSSHQRNVENIFDQYLKNMNKGR